MKKLFILLLIIFLTHPVAAQVTFSGGKISDGDISSKCKGVNHLTDAPKKCVGKPFRAIGGQMEDGWSKEFSCPAEVFVASDISQTTKEKIDKTLAAAAQEWGNFGPVEYWVLGADENAAIDLITKYCQRRNDRGDLDYNQCLKKESSIGKHTGRTMLEYQRIGYEALKSKKRKMSAGHKGGMEWGIHRFTSSMPLGMEEKLGQSGNWDQVHILHEYFHGVQHAHVRSLERDKRSKLLGPRNSTQLGNVWFMEGSATYLAFSTHAKLTAGCELESLSEERVDFHNVMLGDFEKVKSMQEKLDCVSRMPVSTYSDPCKFFFYNGGAWAIAYLLNEVGQDALTKTFYPNLEKLGWEKTFQLTFGKTSKKFYEEFEIFITGSKNKALKILPSY